MSNCKFVRKVNSTWEFGNIRIENPGASTEKRIYKIDGTAKSYEDACTKNGMAAEGMPRHSASSSMARRYA